MGMFGGIMNAKKGKKNNKSIREREWWGRERGKEEGEKSRIWKKKNNKIGGKKGGKKGWDEAI